MCDTNMVLKIYDEIEETQEEKGKNDYHVFL